MAPNSFHPAAIKASASWALSPTARGTAVVAEAAPAPFWLDRPERPAARGD